jgi:hypothetical protein
MKMQHKKKKVFKNRKEIPNKKSDLNFRSRSNNFGYHVKVSVGYPFSIEPL